MSVNWKRFILILVTGVLAGFAWNTASGRGFALRAAADRFRARVQAGVDLAASRGRDWNDLPAHEQLAYYAQARLTEGDRDRR